MSQTSRSRLKLAAIVALPLLGLAACAESPPPQPVTPPAPVVVSTAKEAVGVVQSVNARTRQVAIRTPSEGTVTVIAGPEVQNFARIRRGDRVRVRYEEAVAVQLTPRGTQLPAELDLGAAPLTENTRAASPPHFISNPLEAKRGGHPANVVFLTCDASGVLPPISRLTPDQAVYHFMSGYTSKIAGTEIGLGVEPVITFSACFGGPFMVHHPHKYAQMLKARILKHGAKVWMVNTGWTGGPFGVGKRISIQYTRALLDAALSGRLDGVEFGHDPVFGVAMPKSCEGVPPAILDPASTWPSREEFEQRRRSLAARFIENFELMAGSEPGARGLEVHGPRL